MDTANCGHLTSMGVIDARPSLSVELPARPDSVRAARRLVRDALRDVAIDRDAVALAVSEAVSNAILHGCPPGSPAATVRLRASVDADTVEIVIADDGPGLRPRPDSPGAGLGLSIIASLTDELELATSHGTQLRLRFAVLGPASPRREYERALEITEAAYGPDHPDVGIRRSNLGGVLQALGDLA